MTAMQQMLMSYGGDAPITLREILGGAIGTSITTRETIAGPSSTQGYLNSTYGVITTNSAKGYSMLWRTTSDVNNTGGDVQVRFSDDAAIRQEFNVEPQDTSDRFSFGGVYAFQGDNTTQLMEIETGAELSSTTAGWQGVEALILTHERYDVYNTSSGTSTTTLNVLGGNYTTKCSVTIPKTGFYLLIGTGSFNTPTTTGASGVRIWNDAGTVTYADITPVYRKDTTNWVPTTLSNTVELTSGTVVNLAFGSDGTNTASFRQATLVAIYIGTSASIPTEMPNYYYAADNNVSTTTSTSFVNKLSSTFTIANPSNTHLLIATAQLASSTTSASALAQLFNTSTSVNYNSLDWSIEAFTTTTPPYIGLFVASLVSFTQSSNTLAWRYRSEASGTSAAMKWAHIALIDLGFTG